jgi:superfamily II DNA or RNA helicase
MHEQNSLFGLTELPAAVGGPSGLRDNYSRGTVGDFLRDAIAPGAKLSVVTAYFTIYAYERLRGTLDGIDRMRFLFGEPRFARDIDPDKADTKAFLIENGGLSLGNALTQKAVARACADWMRDKVDIRSIRQSNLLHAKMYAVENPPESERENNAILGSSNFTVRGLGLGTQGNNIELNLVVDSHRDRTDLRRWFDGIWNDKSLVEDVKDKVLAYLEQLYENRSPEFIYYKTLFHIFEKYLDEQKRDGFWDDTSRLTDTQIWNTLFPFQQDGVKGVINKIKRHDGCILADSVGLGKTFEALAVIKYFEQRNDKVLVLCPRKLRENWTVYQASNASKLNPFPQDRFGYTVLSHTDLSREKGMAGGVDLEQINWGNFDLVVIDESHNFRNNARGKRGEDGEVLSESRYEKLMRGVLQSGARTKVLLLSATPVNNDLKDLRNQIYLITGEKDEAFAGAESLGVASVKNVLKTAQQTFTQWADQAKHTGKERRTAELLEKLNSAFFTLLDGLTIARSRKHIQTYYADALEQVGQFPKRAKPHSIYAAQVDTEGRFPAYDALNQEITGYTLALFKPSQYVRPEFAKLYEDEKVSNFSQQKRENYLAGMMKVNFLKRLESSVFSFAVTMHRTVEKIEEVEKKIDAFLAAGAAAGADSIAAQDWMQDIGEEEGEGDLSDGDEELAEALQVGVKRKFQLAHLDLKRWRRDLEADRKRLQRLHTVAAAVDVAQDAKLAELKQLLREKAQNPTRTTDGHENRKALVFTAFADTARYLYDALSDWARKELGVHIALVTGGTGGNAATLAPTDFNSILTNFSPRAKRRAQVPSLPQDQEIDILIATDCISEGQNLQDCDLVVNYDIHWNPVRLIQRFGRIDRIGSRSPAVKMVNFWPTDDLNQYIDLKNRVEARMALVDVTATGYDGLLNPEEIEDLVKTDLNFRDKQLLRLKDEVLDLEDMTETVSLSEFTLDEFRIDLLNFLQENRKKLEAAPLGLYACVPAPVLTHPQLQPGVVFCLRQRDALAGRDSERVNPLAPHFLVYVRDTGEVRYNFTHARQVLEIFRLLCSGATSAFDDLCDAFDRDTSNGQDMAKYSKLLEDAVAAIAQQFQKRNVSNLFSGRGGKLTDAGKHVSRSDDFELITWLVLCPEVKAGRGGAAAAAVQPALL